MIRILHIDSSVEDAETSHSRRLSAALVDAISRREETVEIIRRDVEADRLAHITDSLRKSWMADAGERDAAQRDQVALSEGLIEELRNSDVIVIGAPMYNFTVASTLKAWIDHVAIAGQTFKYTEQGPKGMLYDRKVYLALSSGGVYSEGPAQSLDHLSTYLTDFLGLLGISDIDTVWAEGVAMGPGKSEEAMQQAHGRIETLVGNG